VEGVALEGGLAWVGVTALLPLVLFGLHRALFLARFHWAPNVGEGDQERSSERDWPSVTVQLPLYNERAVAARLLECIGRLDYPREKLQVQVLDDSTDETRAVVERGVALLKKKGIKLELRRRTRRKGFKAGALHAGLATAEGELICIFDADFMPGPNFLRETVGTFEHPRVGAVQARWGHHNRDANVLTRAEATLLDGHFVIEHKVRYDSGLFFNFNGTAGLWRRTAIDQSGGWSGDTLTEDLDLSYRAQLAGWRIVYLPHVVVPGEIPEGLAAYRSQQYRWARGSLQVLRKLGWAILRSRERTKVKIESLVHLVGNVGHPFVLVLAALLPLTVRMPHGPGGFGHLVPFFACTATYFLFYEASQRAVGRPLLRRLTDVLFAMSLGIGMAVNQTRAVMDGLFRGPGVFVRTPKRGDNPTGAATSSEGSAPGDQGRSTKVPWLELLFSAWFVWGVYNAAVLGHWGAVPFQVLFLSGFLWVGLQSMPANHRLSTSLCLFLIPALFLFSPPVSAQEPSVSDLVARIQQERDATPPKVIESLAKRGNRESFEGLCRAVSAMSQRPSLRTICRAFRFYKNHPELAEEAIEFLDDKSDSGLAPLRQSATEGLREFGADAHDELRLILAKSKDKECRALAIGPLIPSLVEDGSVKSLKTILDNAWFQTSVPWSELVKALASFAGEDAQEEILDRLGGKKVRGLMKMALVEVVSERKDEDVERALIGCLKDKNPGVQFRALEALSKREGDAYLRQAEKLMRSKDAAVRRLAVITLSKLRGDEERWVREVLSMAKDKSPATRQGAAVALGELRTPEALRVLYGMLRDEDRSVATETLQIVGNLRRKDSVSVLIDRLSGARGQAKIDVHQVLQLVTGLDHGRHASRWRTWWSHEGEGYSLPTYEEAMRSTRARRAAQKSSETSTSFYGLQVVSERVCFILDVSGSMKHKTPSGTRLEIAQRELSSALDKYPDENLFNVLFFSTDVYPWQDSLVVMGKKTREAAKGFVSRQVPDGYTAIYDALKLAFEDERVDTLYLLSDGSPDQGTVDDPEQIRAEVRRWNSTRHLKIHCVSLGGAIPLLRNLAKDTGGEFRTVR
jgi:HEAT repeat protein